MKVDRRRWETSVVRARILATGLVLVLAGCAILGLSSRSRRASVSVASAPGVDGAVAGLLSSVGSSQEVAASETQARSLFAGLPIIFEPNQGQGGLDVSEPRAKFVARGAGYSLFLGSDGAILSLVAAPSSSAHGVRPPRQVNSVEMKLAGANSSVRLSGAEQLPGRSNYFIGNDPAKWRTSVPQFARVRYASVYPGIDLVFYGNQGHLEYDFQVAPGADPSQAELEFNGAKGVELQDGALVIKTANDSIRLEAPRVYQEIDGRKEAVQSHFVVRGANRAGFAIGSYDRSRELVIDPILSFSTYFGGSGDEHATSVAVDGSFNIYLAGSTTSPNLPAVGTFQTTLNGAQNVYVAKMTPPLGSIVAALDYVTYLGGNGVDTPVGIKVDGRGDAFVAGTTSSTNFPTSLSNAYQATPKAGSTGTTHVFVTELNSGPSPAPASTLPYSSYLSGTGTDVASGMTIDAQGNVYVTGTTTSQDVASTLDQFPASTIPQMQAFQSAPRSSIQFFVTKVNTQASGTGSISYSTYFGGGSSNTSPPVVVGGGIAADTSGNVYFSGTTNFSYTGCAGCGTTDFPILDAYQPCLDLPPTTTVTNPPSCSVATSTTASDAFVAKLNLNQNVSPGQQLLWSTYLGGTGDDSSTGVALDTGAANVYVIGTTDSPDFVASTTLASIASYQKCLNNLPQTTTTNPTCTAQTPPVPTDAFVARVSNPTNKTGTAVNVALGYFSYLGGANNEAGNAITVDSAAGAVITGWTQSPNTGADGTFPVFPNPNSIQGTLNGPQDAFVARLNTAASVGQTTIASWANYFGGTGTDSGTGIALDVNQNTYLSGDTNSADLQVNKPLPTGATNSGGYDAFVAQLGTAVSLSIQGSLTLGANQTFIPAGSQATFTYIITNNGPDLASGITVQDNLSSSVTGVPVTFVSASTSAGSCGGVSTGAVVSCSLTQLQSGSTATVTIIVTPTGNSSGSQATFNGGTVQVLGQGNIVFAQTSVPATMSDFSMQAGPINQSVAIAGDAATYTVQLTPHPLFTPSVSLSCTGNPANSSCIFNPSSVAMQATSGSTSTMTVTTTPRPITTTAANSTRLYYAVALLLPGLVFTFGGSRRRKVAGMLMLCGLLSLLILVPACSHSTTQTPSAGTPAGTYTITVTATSGSDSKSQTVSLTVP